MSNEEGPEDYQIDYEALNKGSFVRSLVNAHVSAAFRPRDEMTKGYLDQFRSEGGCAGLVLTPELYILWGISLLITAPFSRKE